MTAQPAAAHGDSSTTTPTNYRVQILSITPRVPGLDVRVVDLGEHLEVTNRTRRNVIVLGYDSEPYLRIGSDGVFEDTRSPAAYLNDQATPEDVRIPDRADPAAPPEWRRIGDGPTTRWHDHRAHWMANDDPPAVRRSRGSRHVVQNWTVALQRGSDTVTVTGDIVWVPGPSPWLWLAAAVALAAAVTLLSRTRFWRTVVATALALTAVSAGAYVVGEWDATTASAASKLGAGIYALLGVLLAAGGLAMLTRVRHLYDAAPLVMFAGLVLFLTGGLAHLTTLWNSQIATTPPNTIRAAVVVLLGAGAGLATAAALRLRPPGAPRAADQTSRVAAPA